MAHGAKTIYQKSNKLKTSKHNRYKQHIDYKTSFGIKAIIFEMSCLFLLIKNTIYKRYCRNDPTIVA